MLSPEGAMVVRVSASTVAQPTTTETISTSPDSSVASLAALRGKRLRKYSETDASTERLSSSVKSDGGSSQLYTKVPLTPLAVEDNVDYNFKRQASVRIKKMTSASYHDGSSLFPKLNDCAHFHYDHVELGSVQISMHEESEDRTTLVEQNGGATDLLDCPFTLRMLSQGKVWLLKRCYEDFRVLDKQLHKCIYDRRFSQLVELPKGETLTGREAVRAMLTHYVTRFSQIAGDMINCVQSLTGLSESSFINKGKGLDNHGNHVVASEESAINIPAVAAAHVIKRYAAQAPDEISLEVGDMISVIDMPPPEDTSWWRGKNKFDVGFFPRQCVEIISEKLPLAVAERVPKGPKPEVMSLEASGTWSQSGVTNTQTSMLRKHGKLITFLRSFILERPTRRRLKQSGILKERVFGCDLGEHLLNTGTDVPNIVQDCCQFIEQYGICDGIYRLSGVASNVQYLRDQFDSETTPNLDEYKKDIHCVSSVCKLYFRELPNPLLTYQLYQKFEEAAMSGEENRLMKMHDTVQQLPPPHYRTLQFLIRHLSYMSSFSGETSMNIKNLAIVWAPNLLRSKDIETGSCAAFMEIKVQATVVEYLVKHCDLIFNDKLFPDVPGVGHEMQRPKSLVLSTPTKLLSLEEARARSSSQGNEGGEKDEKPKFIEVGGGPAALPKQYHTVIDLPPESRKRFSASKSKKSPGWRAFFSRSTGKEVKRKMSHDPASLRVPNSKHFGARGHRASLRSVKSAESLSSAESASELQGQDKYSNIHDPARFKGHLRRSSVACMENTLRRSSSDSFFEVDADIVAAATREMLAAQRGEDTYSRDEIFIEEESGATCQLGRRRGSGANSPLWIDQSVSSMESDRASVRSPYAHQPSFQIGRQMSAENNWHIDDVQMSCSANVHYEETPPPSPTEVSSPERYQCTIAEPVAVPQRHPLKTSIAMPVAAAFTPEYRDVEMTESGGSATSPDHSGSVLDKISRAMSIKSKAKLKRESSTEADDYSSLGRSPDTGVDDVMDRPIMVTVRTQTSPHDTLDEMDTGEEVRKYDVNLQTSGSDGAVFMRTPAQRRSMNLDLFSGLDEALLGTTAPRPKSIHVSSHLSRGSESYDDDFGSFTTRLSLDNVLSEYDHILAKYNNRPLTPDFDRSDEMCKYDGMYSGQRISSPRHGITPVTALNSNCNNTRHRRLQHRYSMGDETRAEHFNNRYSSVIMDNGETRKRLSAGAVLDHHTPAQDNDEEVVVVRLRRPRPPSTQKKLYASPERFSINSPEFQASLADQQNGNTPPESATDLRTLKKDDGQCHASSVDAVYHVTLPTRPSSQRRGISKSFSLDFQSSIPDANTRIGDGFVGEGTDNAVNEAEAGRAGTAHEDAVRLDNLEDDQMPEREDSSSFAYNASVHPSTDQSPIIDRYPLIISDELEL